MAKYTLDNVVFFKNMDGTGELFYDSGTGFSKISNFSANKFHLFVPEKEIDVSLSVFMLENSSGIVQKNNMQTVFFLKQN